MQDATNLWRNLLLGRLTATRLIAVAVVVLVSVGLLTACGGEPVSGDTRPRPDAQPNPTAGNVGEQPGSLNELQIRAREVLASRLSVPAESLTLISDERVQWSDASLGCPQEGMAYAQVITPGHRITFQHNGNTYEVHTAAADSRQEPVSCEGGTSY